MKVLKVPETRNGFERSSYDLWALKLILRGWALKAPPLSAQPQSWDPDCKPVC